MLNVMRHERAFMKGDDGATKCQSCAGLPGTPIK